MAVRRPKSNKNPPILSHEFIIQNHADIVSCVAMIFVIGLMFQATSPISALFVGLQHNVTVNVTETETGTLYTYGFKDFFTTSFYFLICIVVHAVVQEYVLDKLNRKMHLSKVKHSKFNESGQLIAFYAASAAWGIDIIVRLENILNSIVWIIKHPLKRELICFPVRQENYLMNINSLWEDYPHAQLAFIIKFYFLIQIAYWIHNFPELYFQKIKRDEMPARIQYSALYIVFIVAAYLLNLSRVALCLMVLHYTVELVFHLSRMLYFAEKSELSNTGFMVWNVLFVMVRLGSITLAVLTFWYGLEKSGSNSLDVATGNFNTQIVRVNCLVAVCLLQAWMMWNFITFHLKRLRERKESATVLRKSALQTQASKKPTQTKKKGEVENGSVRQRSPSSKKAQ